MSRAAETQRFVVACNTAHPRQLCPSLIADPRGVILEEAPWEGTALLRQTLDTSAVSNWYLGQDRPDVPAVAHAELPRAGVPGGGPRRLRAPPGGVPDPRGADKARRSARVPGFRPIAQRMLHGRTTVGKGVRQR